MKKYILLLIMIATTSSISFGNDSSINLDEIELIMDVLVDRAKNLYRDFSRGGNQEIPQNMLNISGVVSILKEDTNNGFSLNKANIHPNYEIRLQFNFAGDLVNIALKPIYESFNVNISRYECYTDFDKILMPKYSGLVKPGTNRSASLIKDHIYDKNLLYLSNCIYVDPTKEVNFF